jgi:hypothetical protein
MLKSMLKAYSKTMGILALACEYTLSHKLATESTKRADNSIAIFLFIEL